MRTLHLLQGPPVKTAAKIKRSGAWKLILLSFVLPILAMLPGFIYAGIWPFGSNTTMAVDLRHEYVGFYEAFRHALTHPGGFFYNMTKSFGGEMAGTFSYYMMSPFNLLFFLFPRSGLPEIIEITQLIKIGLCGAFFSVFLIYSERGRDWRVVLFSTLYGLVSFATANLLNHMWLDPIALFPLVVLGVEKLIRGESALLYVTTLTLSILTNFYIAYMSCLFLALYVIYALVRKPGKVGADPSLKFAENVHMFIRFGIYSVLAGALCAALLFPTLYSMAESKGSYAGDVIAPFVFDYPPADFVAKLIPGAFNYDQVPSGLPNVFTGTITIIFAIAYFFTRRIPLRERITALLIMAFLVLSMNIKWLTVLWHGMQYPVWYEYRFSWLFSFFAVLLAYRAMMTKSKPATSVYLVIAALYAAMIVYLYLNLSRFDFLTVWHLLAAVLVFAVLSALIWLRPLKKRAFAVVLIAVCWTEMAVNAGFHTGCYNYEPLAEFHFFEDEMNAALKGIVPEDGQFWRIEKTFMHDNNDGMRFNYPTLTHFNSALDRKSVDMLSNLGFATTKNSVNGTNPTKITDALFDVRYYLVSRKDDLNFDIVGMDRLKSKSYRPDVADMKKVASTKYIDVYENPNALSLGLVAEQSLATLTSDRQHPMDFQDNIFNAIDGIPGDTNYLRRLSIGEAKLTNVEQTDSTEAGKEYRRVDPEKDAEITIPFKVETKSSHYLAVANTLTSSNSELYLDGEKLANKRVGYNRRSQIYNVSCETTGDHELTIKMKKDARSLTITNISLFVLDEPAFEKAVEFQKQHELKLTERTDTRIAGTFEATADTPYMLITLPYDKGWEVTVDGAPVKTFAALGSLIGFPVTAGKHEVLMTYHLPGFKTGSLITLAALIFVAILIYSDRIIRYNQPTPPGYTMKNYARAFDRVRVRSLGRKLRRAMRKQRIKDKASASAAPVPANEKKVEEESDEELAFLVSATARPKEERKQESLGEAPRHDADRKDAAEKDAAKAEPAEPAEAKKPEAADEKDDEDVK